MGVAMFYHLTRSSVEETLMTILPRALSQGWRVMLRGTDAAERGLPAADDATVLAAMAADPILIERPIVVRGDQAVIGRPPSLIKDLLTS